MPLDSTGATNLICGVERMNDKSELLLNDRLKCLSCTTRRNILLLTRTQALTARDIAGQLNLAQNTIKRHIKILMDSELLIQHRVNNRISYSTNVECLYDTIQQLNSNFI